MRKELPVDQLFPAGAALEWHNHSSAYAAVVMDGRYMEAGDGGRLHAEAGDVVIHGSFMGHRNCIGSSGARVINIPLDPVAALRLDSGRLRDPDEALREISETGDFERCHVKHVEAPMRYLTEEPDLLATAIEGHGDLSLAAWARRRGFSERTLTRQFKSTYGITPAQFRWRARALCAWRAVVQRATPLSMLAHDLGFSDQAHMSRSVVQLTGLPPGRWRRWGKGVGLIQD